MQANEILRIINIAKIVKVNDVLFPLPQSSDFCILYSTWFYLMFLGKVASVIIKMRMGKHPDFAQTGLDCFFFPQKKHLNFKSKNLFYHTSRILLYHGCGGGEGVSENSNESGGYKTEEGCPRHRHQNVSSLNQKYLMMIAEAMENMHWGTPRV